MENVRKIINVRLRTNEKDFFKYTNRPTHIAHKIFGKNYAAIHEMKPVLKLNKPVYCSRIKQMVDVWFPLLKKIDAELLFTDTDSLTYDVYAEFYKHRHLFDFSNLPKNSKFFDKANKKVIGKMKDVSEGKIIGEFVGLKSKMHSIKNIDGKETNKAKGVSVATEFKKFKNILFNKKIMRHKMRRIQAKNHKIGTYEINEISLWCFDDKGFVLKDDIHTLAYVQS